MGYFVEICLLALAVLCMLRLLLPPTMMVATHMPHLAHRRADGQAAAQLETSMPETVACTCSCIRSFELHDLIVLMMCCRRPFMVMQYNVADFISGVPLVLICGPAAKSM